MRDLNVSHEVATLGLSLCVPLLLPAYAQTIQSAESRLRTAGTDAVSSASAASRSALRSARSSPYVRFAAASSPSCFPLARTDSSLSTGALVRVRPRLSASPPRRSLSRDPDSLSPRAAGPTDATRSTSSRRSSTSSSSSRQRTARTLCVALIYSFLFARSDAHPLPHTRTQATVIISRFIGGIAASTGSTMVGGTVADLFDTHERGLPMAIFSITAFAGTGLGPAVSGYIELKLGWRWISWVQVRRCSSPRQPSGSLLGPAPTSSADSFASPARR